MNSFDLFNTLIACKNGSERAGDVPIEHLIPILENIAKVKQGDLIISDFYDASKALYILRNICKLDNELICTEDGKATGKVWESMVKPIHHLGDNEQIDVITPRRYGIETTLSSLWELTQDEKMLGHTGLIMRQARLTSWHENGEYRGLQLHQIERNFPFLLKVATILNNKMKEGYNRLLLCSRDCYLLHQLMMRLFPTCNYAMEYFYNNRLMRYNPSEEYLKYAKPLIPDEKTLIVDMCGSGWSLKTFCDAHSGTPLLIVSHKTNTPSLIEGIMFEISNPAPHASITCWPQVFNETASERNKIMINTLLQCIDILIQRGEHSTDYELAWALKRIEDNRTNCLRVEHAAETKVMEELIQVAIQAARDKVD